MLYKPDQEMMSPVELTWLLYEGIVVQQVVHCCSYVA
jgi:hypothetical protein